MFARSSSLAWLYASLFSGSHGSTRLNKKPDDPACKSDICCLKSQWSEFLSCQVKYTAASMHVNSYSI